jgi:hypothetical protein
LVDPGERKLSFDRYLLKAMTPSPSKLVLSLGKLTIASILIPF